MQWHKETDVVVIGYGAAGGAAAIEAHDLGAQVVILEKNPEPGGITQHAGGRMREVVDPKKYVDVMEALCEGTTPRDVLEAFVFEGERNPEWIRKLGGEIEPAGDSFDNPDKFPIRTDPAVKGIEVVSHEKKYWVKGDARGGANLMSLLKRNITARKISVLLETPVRRLVKGEKGQGIIGVIAETSNRSEINIKARRGVVLACGGFEGNPDMQRNFLGIVYLPFCNPNNTGDGIKMAMEVGSDLWHMNALNASYGYKIPGYDAPVPKRMPAPGYIYLDHKGKRFCDEGSTDPTMLWSIMGQMKVRDFAYPRIPTYVIFDENTMRSGPIGDHRGRITDLYLWSKDNRKELEAGWIKMGRNLGELAGKLGIRADILQETVGQYNLRCVQGYDPEFDRDPRTLVPLLQPPFFAVEAWPCVTNTQGGPRRDARARVLDVWGKPIRRLYSAGELGSLWNRVYLGSNNVKECLAFGRIAARNIVAEPPWDE